MLSKLYNWIERRSVPRVNWIKTLYFNFRVLPFKQARLLPVLVYGNPVLNSLSGRFVFECQIKRGLVEINKQATFAPSLQTEKSQICIYGTIIIKGSVFIGCGTKILVAHSGSLTLSHNTRIMDCCNIDCWSQIEIGEESRISHRCQIMDSNHHYIIDWKTRKISDNHKPIIIGTHCWICNSTTILPGAILPDYCIVAGHSIINKDMSFCGQHVIVGGMPAKLLKSDVSRIFNKEFELMIFEYYNQAEADVYELDHNIDIKAIIHN